MKRLIKYALIIITVLLAVAAVGFFGFAPGYVARNFNEVIVQPPYDVSERAKDLHASLFIADLHADSLVWGYDLNERQTQNHVDLPRLIEGNVALQAFTVVTKSPRGLNIEHNDDKTDNMFWLALGQRQPIENLFSLTKRAIYQAKRLHEFAASSGGRLMVIENKRDLATLIERRRNGETVVGGMLGIEGAHALDGDVGNVDVLYDAGYRMMSPSHFFDTEMGGSAHGIEKYGLTEKGREMVRLMEEKQMLVDLAHSSASTIDDVLEMAARPVVVSHTGVKGVCDNNRNLTDDQLRRIAATGGVVGIGFWDTAVCGEDAAAIARSIKYTADLIGIEHVALGSDFDGAIRAPFDVTGEPLITEALIAEGFSDEDIAKIMGGNVLRLLSEELPD